MWRQGVGEGGVAVRVEWKRVARARGHHHLKNVRLQPMASEERAQDGWGRAEISAASLRRRQQCFTWQYQSPAGPRCPRFPCCAQRACRHSTCAAPQRVGRAQLSQGTEPQQGARARVRQGRRAYGNLVDRQQRQKTALGVGSSAALTKSATCSHSLVRCQASVAAQDASRDDDAPPSQQPLPGSLARAARHTQPDAAMRRGIGTSPVSLWGAR